MPEASLDYPCWPSLGEDPFSMKSSWRETFPLGWGMKGVVVPFPLESSSLDGAPQLPWGSGLFWGLSVAWSSHLDWALPGAGKNLSLLIPVPPPRDEWTLTWARALQSSRPP